MSVRKILPLGALLTAAALGPATASPAFAAETALVVEGPVSAPGGWSQASCPSGSHLTGGGYQLPSGTPDTVVHNAPSPDGRSWLVRADRARIKAFAVCETE
ncbi:hypothetical protein ACIBCA_27835 [Kitasatospora sp. NPDC051170]|uniref:hypothetical protein n=1 Tax=Kitasatospora sp. NPDC051170 TaxID=3364056 RepID=UPI0037B0CC19